MKLRSIVPLVFLIVVFLVTSVSSVSAEPDAPDELIFGTHPTGSLFYATATGLGEVLTDRSDYDVTVIGTAGPVEWFPRFTTGEAELGLANVFDAHHGYLGNFDYEPISNGEGFPARTLMVGFPLINAPVTAEGTNITEGEDIAGSRYVYHYRGSTGITRQAEAFLANFNLSEEDVIPITVPGVPDGVRFVLEDRADVNAASVVGMPIVEELDATRGARFISLDPSDEAVERLQEHFPGYIVEVEPGPPGVVEDPTYMMAYDTYLLAREDLSDEAAYHLVKTLWEHYEELAPIHPRLEDWTPDRFVSEEALVPYHPGAIEFYREVGEWDEEMDELQQELLDQK